MMFWGSNSTEDTEDRSEKFLRYILTHGIVAVNFSVVTVICFVVFNILIKDWGIPILLNWLICAISAAAIGAVVALRRYRELQKLHLGLQNTDRDSSLR